MRHPESSMLENLGCFMFGAFIRRGLLLLLRGSKETEASVGARCWWFVVYEKRKPMPSGIFQVGITLKVFPTWNLFYTHLKRI